MKTFIIAAYLMPKCALALDSVWQEKAEKDEHGTEDVQVALAGQSREELEQMVAIDEECFEGDGWGELYFKDFLDNRKNMPGTDGRREVYKLMWKGEFVGMIAVIVSFLKEQTDELGWKDYVSKFEDLFVLKEIHFQRFHERQAFVACLTDFDYMIQIASLGIKESARRNGFGRKLMEFVLQKYETAKYFELQVKVGNPAINLYRKCGFNFIKVEENYYGDGDHAWIMHRPGQKENSRPRPSARLHKTVIKIQPQLDYAVGKPKKGEARQRLQQAPKSDLHASDAPTVGNTVAHPAQNPRVATVLMVVCFILLVGLCLYVCRMKPAKPRKLEYPDRISVHVDSPRDSRD